MLSGPAGDKLVAIHDSAIAPWTTDLLGLFYVPAVAIMPVLLQGIAGELQWEGAWRDSCRRRSTSLQQRPRTRH
jgi:hypothetical protein